MVPNPFLQVFGPSDTIVRAVQETLICIRHDPTTAAMTGLDELQPCLPASAVL